jgi:uncharacterized protein (AIM24 family)
MTELPDLIPPKGSAKTYADVAYHIGDDAVPVLTVDVSKTQVYFEHHSLLWKHPSVIITLREAHSGPRRAPGGEQVLIAEASGEGMIAFRRDGPGQIVTLQMPLGREIFVHEHRFLAASRAVSYETLHLRTSGLLHTNQGYAMQKFLAGKGDGVLWLYAYGQVFEKILEDGESIDIEPGAWLYKDRMVGMETIASRLPLGRFGNHATLYINRFTGPGRVAVQSMYVHSRPTEP